MSLQYDGQFEVANNNTGNGDDDVEVYYTVEKANVRTGDDDIYVSGEEYPLTTNLNVNSGSGDDLVDLFKWTFFGRANQYRLW